MENVDLVGTDVRVALVNMPFCHLSWPSIALSLLKPALERRSISCDVHYLNLGLPSFIGLATYQQIARLPPFALVGEWLFAEQAFGSCDDTSYLDWVGEVIASMSPDVTPNVLLRARTKIGPYIEACLDSVGWANYSVVGFTSIFEQTVASLALARRIKMRWPDTVVLFGGPNCETPMGKVLLETQFVDAVCMGEGDITLPRFVEALASGSGGEHIPGILTKANLQARRNESAVCLTDLNTLPYPDYADYFEQLTAADLEKELNVELPFESARGCWWGQKHQCKFCGLVGKNLGYRSKTQGRALEEFFYLRERYRDHSERFFATDNILDHRYFEEFFPELARQQPAAGILYFTKANLDKYQVRLLKMSGCSEIQPGVESLSTDVLRKINKGIDMLRNVQLLKWCKEYGVVPYWNLIYGFPDEDPRAYRDVPGVIEQITHLQPPFSCGRFRLERFSEYFNNAPRYGLEVVRPFASYRHVYRNLDSRQLTDIAYYFEYGYADRRDVQVYAQPVRDAVECWQQRHSSAVLCFTTNAEGIELYDSRSGEMRVAGIRGWRSEAYRLCDSVTTPRTVRKRLLELGHGDISDAEIRDELDGFVARGLMLMEGNRYLSLAIPVGEYAPPDAVLIERSNNAATGTSGG